MESSKQTLGEIVAANYRTATVFGKYNLDFCCQGNRTLTEACAAQGLDASAIQHELDSLPTADGPVDFKQWPLDLLTDYIYKRHHQYLEQTTPAIKNLLNKICSVHGPTHPELDEIRSIFEQTSGALAVHMKKEELMLFPFIKKMVAAQAQGSAIASSLFSTVMSPIEEMRDDHSDEGEQLRRMRQLSNNFVPPPDACTTFTTTYQLLQEYESDIHMHIHLENNILFPAAIRLESVLTAGSRN
jgi:regulator of cell morphogenesis and NO signaling